MKRINDGQEEPAKSDLCDRPRSGRPSSAHSSANIDQADALIKENRRMTINECCKDYGYPAVFKSVRKWVLRKLTEAHEQSRPKACFDLLEYCHSDKSFLQRIVTRDEAWVHHFKPESRRVSMEWRHPTSPR